MELLKKLALTALIILFLISIMKDLTEGVVFTDNQATVADQIEEKKQEESPSKKEKANPQKLKAVERKVEPGDTVLSIVEEINQLNEGISIQKIQDDFKILNPGSDPNNIQVDTSYLFPIYDQE
ncbi:hypothetical protein KO561_11265 [Radiobacillus kanasensis]|uniref:hypothetical protein n=1 Tax=Radiobacillus kanasensis TaxID=2844358 RepID=UPI001E4FDF8C|nr:hypothetical protein [Radiobacillus kanasensis]UFT97795.1 hypothetical protein KO561_11265 [Radiobacillus kanasensis]